MVPYGKPYYPAMVVHGFHGFGQLPVRVHQYGLLRVSVLPRSHFPAHFISLYPMDLADVRKLSIVEPAPFTARSFQHEAREVVAAMRSAYARYLRHFKPEQARTLYALVDEVEGLLEAGEDPADVVAAVEAVAEYLREHLEGKVAWDELARVIDEFVIEPMARARSSVRDHLARLIGAGFDSYVYLHIEPAKKGISEFLRRRLYHQQEKVGGRLATTPEGPRLLTGDLPTTGSLVFSLDLQPTHDTKRHGHLVFAPFVFRTVTSIQHMGGVGAGMLDTTRGSDYAAVYNAERYGQALTDAMDHAHANVELSYQLIATKTPPPGYRREDMFYHLSALELHLARVWAIEGGGVLHRFRWNFNLLFRVVYGVKWKAKRGRPDPQELALHLDSLAYRLNQIRTDYPDFLAGAIERLGELRGFAARLPEFKRTFKGVEGFGEFFD